MASPRPDAQESLADSAILPADHWAELPQHEDDDDDDDGGGGGGGDGNDDDDDDDGGGEGGGDGGEDHDRDSAFGDQPAAESTASISSSILAYRTIHGRTYHSERGNAQYWASNDERANESMDLNHHLLTLCLRDKLYLAPIKPDRLKKVLDVGTGTGIWAIDFADAHPDAEVIGTDISPIQPSWIPPNLQFQIDDCTQDWTFPPNTFDYVHMRYLVGSIADWHALFAQAFAALAPGGHLESLEGSPSMESDDGTVDPRSAMGQWGRFFLEGGRATGRSFAVVADGVQRAAMEAAGFVDVQEWDYKVPIGPWPRDRRLRELGSVAQLTLQEDEEGYVLFMANVLAGWSREQIHVYIAHLRRQLRAGKSHAYFRLKAVWGRKPEVETGGN